MVSSQDIPCYELGVSYVEKVGVAVEPRSKCVNGALVSRQIKKYHCFAQRTWISEAVRGRPVSGNIYRRTCASWHSARQIISVCRPGQDSCVRLHL